MKYCPNCNLPLLGFVHSNEKQQGKTCLKCKQIFELEAFHTPQGDYEELILARQETEFD